MLETVSIICLAQFSRLLLGMDHCVDIGRAVTKHEMRCANCFLICTFVCSHCVVHSKQRQEPQVSMTKVSKFS